MDKMLFTYKEPHCKNCDELIPYENRYSDCLGEFGTCNNCGCTGEFNYITKTIE